MGIVESRGLLVHPVLGHPPPHGHPHLKGAPLYPFPRALEVLTQDRLGGPRCHLLFFFFFWVVNL